MFFLALRDSGEVFATLSQMFCGFVEMVFHGVVRYFSQYCSVVLFRDAVSATGTLCTLAILYQDLSYGEILAIRPGAWLVKIFFLNACNQKSLNGTYGEIQIFME